MSEQNRERLIQIKKRIEDKGGLIGITHDREGNALNWTVIGGVECFDDEDNIPTRAWCNERVSFKSTGQE